MILHIDGDSFFASVETSLDHKLRGKPVVTGAERGIASAMSKEAKALGIHRGMPIFKIKKDFPQVIIKPGDYLSYNIFAQRMYAIVGRYSDQVEEYSIDECFALLDKPELVEEIKRTLQSELGLTFSLGLAPTKVLAKLVSSKNKPDGLSILDTEQLSAFLSDIDIGKVWGIGPAMAQELRGKGIMTASDLNQKSPAWARANLNKHTLEIWYELQGRSILRVHQNHDAQKSIQSTRTFSPPTGDQSVLLSELSKNIENAFVKMRRAGQGTRKLHYFVKTQEYRYHRCEIVFDTTQYTPEKAIKMVSETLHKVVKIHTIYRATGVTLAGLVDKSVVQNDLFGVSRAEDRWEAVYKALEGLERRYGSHTLMLGSSLEANRRRGVVPHKRLRIPFIGEVS